MLHKPRRAGPPAPSIPTPRLADQFRPVAQDARFNAGWSSPVARQAHNLKVIGSNPIPATTDSLTSAAGVRLSAFRATRLRIAPNSPFRTASTSPQWAPGLRITLPTSPGVRGRLNRQSANHRARRPSARTWRGRSPRNWDASLIVRQIFESRCGLTFLLFQLVEPRNHRRMVPAVFNDSDRRCGLCSASFAALV